MTSFLRSSGDLLADRRFAYAEALTAEGDIGAAADLLEQVIELAPRWVPAWLALGAARERQGFVEAAGVAFAQAARFDTTGIYGAALHGARTRTGPDQPVMPTAYVAALFDDYAPRFDAHLIETLGYRAPALLAAALSRAVGDRRFPRAIDLGCGTGLMAVPVRGRVGHLSGIDLSPGMVALAEGRGLYDRLLVADIPSCLESLDGASADLLTAADVFAYLGPLPAIAASAARVLRPGGVLAFTVQLGSTAPVMLGPDLRFSHSAAHVKDAIAAVGLDLLLSEQASSRRDAGADVPGLVVVARKPQAGSREPACTLTVEQR